MAPHLTAPRPQLAVTDADTIGQLATPFTSTQEKEKALGAGKARVVPHSRAPKIPEGARFIPTMRVYEEVDELGQASLRKERKVAQSRTRQEKKALRRAGLTPKGLKKLARLNRQAERLAASQLEVEAATAQFAQALGAVQESVGEIPASLLEAMRQEEDAALERERAQAQPARVGGREA